MLDFNKGQAEQIARILLGDPNKKMSSRDELRFGSNGSMSVKLSEGVFYDHEAGEGGDIFKLIKNNRHCSDREVFEWLEQEGFKPHRDTEDTPVPAYDAAKDPFKNRVSKKPDPVRQFTIAQTWTYTDENGNDLFEVCRLENGERNADGKSVKRYYQRHKEAGSNGSVAYVNGVGGIRQVPYKLPELIAAIAKGQTIFVTEGEKCADAVTSIGGFATCNAMGAGKWPDEIVSHFKGADAVILPDNDEPGRKHAQLVASKLEGVAKRVRVLDLPGLGAKQDVADWIAVGGTLAQLNELAESAVATVPVTPQPQPRLTPTPFVWTAPAQIPRRQFLYGRHYIRRFASATVAAGGTGKSSLSIAEALAIATGRDLLGISPDECVKGWLWNGEDPQDELQRRVAAAMLHYEIAPEEVAGRFFLDSGRDTPIILAEQTRDGTKISKPIEDRLIEVIKDNEIGLIIVDPFVSSHRVPENDNNAIDAVAKTWARIAETANCAVELIHHLRKTNGNEATVEDGRGASALVNAVRGARVMNKMSASEAQLAEVDMPGLYFRIDTGKTNVAPPAERASWYRLVSVDLGNGDQTGPGDNIGVVASWDWPSALDGVTTADLRRVQVKIASGDWRESPQAKAWAGNAVAEVFDLDLSDKAAKDRVRRMLAVWTKNGVLKIVSRKDEHREEKRFIVVGEPA